MTQEIRSWARDALESGQDARLGRWVATPQGDLYRGDEESRNSPTVTGMIHMGSAAPAGVLADSLVAHWLGDY